MSDVDDKILEALFAKEPVVEVQEAIVVTLQAKKNYLMRYINVIPIKEKCAIGSILMINNLGGIIDDSNEGCMIDLNDVPEHIIGAMYDNLYHIVESPARR